jgi:hypothetical protein
MCVRGEHQPRFAAKICSHRILAKPLEQFGFLPVGGFGMTLE